MLSQEHYETSLANDNRAAVGGGVLVHAFLGFFADLAPGMCGFCKWCEEVKIGAVCIEEPCTTVQCKEKSAL